MWDRQLAIDSHILSLESVDPFFGGNAASLQDSGTARGDPRVALVAQQAKEIFHANNQNP